MSNEFQNLPAEKQKLVLEAASDMEKPCSPVEVRERLDRTENGGVKNSIKNCLTVFRLDEVLHQSIRYNLFTEKTDIVKPLWWHKRSPVLNETDVNYLMLYLEETYGLSVESKIARAISIIADKNKYHPIQEKLKSLVWDGEKRIENALSHFLGVEKNEYTSTAMQLFMLGAIHRIFRPGCKFEMMLCLVGGQGAGKSMFFRFLAIKDEWFTDDLKKLEDDNVFRKMQGHWIVEMSEMIATANAKSIEDIKSFLSRQKETYKIPYDKQPDDRLRQCVFGGTSNTLDFLPLDRTGNRRFLPIMVCPEKSEVHIMADEKASRAYIEQMWAEAMVIYSSKQYQLALSREMEQYLKEFQILFMPEDTKAGMIQGFLDSYKGNMVCSKMLYKEALNHPFDEPKQWEIREINDIMNNSIMGWKQFTNPRHFAGYGRQKGWERDNQTVTTGVNSLDGFVELTEEEAKQMELPFVNMG